MSEDVRENKIKGIIISGIIASVVALVVAICVVVFSMIKIQELESKITRIETVIFSDNQQGYAFVMRYNDGYIPGKTYYITLQDRTRILTVNETSGCSLLPEECQELDLDSVSSVTLSEDDYDLVMKAYNVIKDKLTVGEGLFYDMNGELFNWSLGISALVRSYMGYGEDYESSSAEELKNQDTNGDGVISEREFAIYTLKLVAEGF